MTRYGGGSIGSGVGGGDCGVEGHVTAVGTEVVSALAAVKKINV